MADETTSIAPRDPAAPPTPGAATPHAVTAAPGYQVRRLYQAYLSVWMRAVDPTLTGPQFAVLTAVDTTPGRDQRSMASAVSLDTSTMADVARRLEGRGLIVRRTDATDGRRKLLFLTEEGERTLGEARERSRRLDERLLAPFEGAQPPDVMELLTSLADYWESLAEDS
ncbi:MULTISPECIES: MarR family transcriptional regulator [unclassified Streptomyces]|uniref:MarR family winged helix-turn-helix transcriptional regulator n=1 Tax=unclassified Streptomyces TaxID=2593676 RepID=UPI00344B3567